MTNAEFKTFLKTLQGYFPKFREWAESLGQDWEPLRQSYFDGLNDYGVTLSEAEQVLKDWKNDHALEGAPVGYEKERFLANLIKVVSRNRTAKRAKESSQKFNREILGECQDLPIRSKVPNKGPLVGHMVEEFERMRSMKLSKGLATV